MTSVAKHTPVAWQPAPSTETTPSATADITALTVQIDAGLHQTQAWVAEHFPGHSALALDDPYAWQLFPKEVRELGGTWMADILAETYGPDGDAYPLKSYIGKDHNSASIASGSILPYYIVVAPDHITKEAVMANPNLLLEHKDQIKPASVCARVKKGDGSEEHGRAAKKQGLEYRGISTKAIILQAYKDAMTEGVPSVYADVRAAAEHDFLPGAKVASGAATQAVYLGKTGLVPTQFVPARYWVGGNEPFVTGEYEESWGDLASGFGVYTHKGDHVAYLEALAELQTGQVPPIKIATEGVGAYLRATVDHPPLQGVGKIYASVRINAEQTGHNTKDLVTALDEADRTAPATIVEIPAHTPEGGSTQNKLQQMGYIVCGFKAAHDRNGSIIPPVVYMTRPGESVRSGAAPVASTHLPEGVYDPRLRDAFENIDQQVRNQITT